MNAIHLALLVTAACVAWLQPLRIGFASRTMVGAVLSHPVLVQTKLDGTGGTVLINEFMASNKTALEDEDGENVDWIELYNPGTEPVALSGWSLTDDPGRPRRWTFPDVSLGGGEYLLVFASGKDRRPVDPGVPLHTDFKLEADGEFLALFDSADPPHMVDGFSPAFPVQPVDVAFGRLGDARLFEYLSELSLIHI